MTEAATIQPAKMDPLRKMRMDAQINAEYIDGKMENLCALFDLFRATYIDIPPAEAARISALANKQRSNVADVITQLLLDTAEAADGLAETIQALNRATA